MSRTSPREDDDDVDDDCTDDDDDDNEDVIFGVYDYDVNDMCSYKESRSIFKYPSSTTSFRNARTISSCNGLICLKTNSKYFLSHHHENLFIAYSITIYNPITKEKLNLRTYDEDDKTYKILTCGFGYHPSTKQYKILRCTSHHNNNHEFQQLWFEIYTLGTTTSGDKWRQIKVPEDPPNFDYHVPGVHVNGALYWITNYFKNKKKRMLMSFDLGDEEEFRIITSLPHSHSSISKQLESSLHYKLKESQGCLYLIVYWHSYIEIWLMIKREKKRRMHEKTETTKKKYKRDHRHHYCWTKVMKIRIDHHRQEEYEFVGLTKSGKVLFWHNRVLTCFDPKTTRFESLRSSSSGAYRRTFVPHVNSLVSLMALQSIDTTGEEKKYLRISKVSKFTLQANATTGEKEYSVEEEYEKFV